MSSKATKTKKEPPVASKVQAPENVMYVGPSIPGIAQHSQVFEKGILPESANKAIGDFPLLNRMFVPISQIAVSLERINSSNDSALKTIYSQCAKHFKGGK